MCLMPDPVACEAGTRTPDSVPARGTCDRFGIHRFSATTDGSIVPAPARRPNTDGRMPLRSYDRSIQESVSLVASFRKGIVNGSAPEELLVGDHYSPCQRG